VHDVFFPSLIVTKLACAQLSALVCSMFALQSCKGFTPNTYHFWCCSKHRCKIEYTEAEFNRLGFTLPFRLEPLSCHELQPSTTDSSGQGSSASPRTKLLAPLLASSFAAAMALASVLLWRHQRASQGHNVNADELRTGKSIQELEMHRRRSKNGPEAVDWPQRDRRMNPLAQTESNNFVTVVSSFSNRTNVPTELTVHLYYISRCYVSNCFLQITTRIPCLHVCYKNGSCKMIDGKKVTRLHLTILLLQNVTVRRGPDFKNKKASADVDTFVTQCTADVLLFPPPANASSSEKIDFLHQQLDSMGVDKEILFGLRLLGRGGRQRLQGGA
jgi:hypothetical protein